MYLDFSTPSGFKFLLFLVLLPPIYALNRWVARGPNTHYVFSYLAGSAVASAMLAFVHLLHLSWFKENPFLIAVGIIFMISLWKFLFGPWSSQIKAAVLGSFVFWIAVHILQGKPENERIAALLATVVALVPAMIWCLLFLHHHRERLSIVVLTFLAGMLSTAPILFYDYIVRSGYQLHFFLFRITPENFMRSSQTFVSQNMTGQFGIISENVAVTIVSFILVAVIEEWSKHWVMRKSNRAFFTSIDDCIQLSIIAAVGFAFAENIVNPSYFISFVKDYLVFPPEPKWGMFFASVFGRSVITNMVHVTSSGVLGYYYGLAFFAEPVLAERRASGQRHILLAILQRLFQVRRSAIFRDEMMFQGLLAAISLHGLFNFLVSIPDVLPGHPTSLGEVFGFSGFGSGISIVSIPAILYVLGGWFLVQYLFQKKENLREFGYKVREEKFLLEPAAA